MAAEKGESLRDGDAQPGEDERHVAGDSPGVGSDLYILRTADLLAVLPLGSNFELSEFCARVLGANVR
jgi:hypothetical protein